MPGVVAQAFRATTPIGYLSWLDMKSLARSSATEPKLAALSIAAVCDPQKVEFASDSLLEGLEGDRFEPSVLCQIFLEACRSPRFTFRDINRLPRDRDLWFESISLQQ
jgi:hypothetical protein